MNRRSDATYQQVASCTWKAATALQSVNHGGEDLIVYVHGWPPEEQHAELLASAGI